MKLKSVIGAIISVEEYFGNEVKNFIEDFDGENENVVESFEHWINEDRDFIAVNDNGDRIENELSVEEEEFYNRCFNAAIEKIKKHFEI
jgi:hypothetical protein